MPHKQRRRSSWRKRNRARKKTRSACSPSRRLAAENAIIASEYDPDLEEYFRRIDAWERGEGPTLRSQLAAYGVDLHDPDDVADSELNQRLWSLIRSLAELGIYLHNTDHLSDRQLYCRLWGEDLQGSPVLMAGNPRFAFHIDLAGSGSEEDIHLYLMHYAGEAARRRWLENFPDAVVPAHVNPPYDRDRFLPAAPF